MHCRQSLEVSPLKTSEWCRVPGYRWRSHQIEVPLDWSEPSGAKITVFTRELRGLDEQTKPYLLYLQGGPGFESPRLSSMSGWVREALKRFTVILLDQRGTGLSSAVDASIVEGRTDAEICQYLSYFRAPSIVRDAEAIRIALAGKETRWTVFGQSFGGFCCLSYLFLAPESLSGVLITGGIPPVGLGPKAVYESLYPTVMERSRRFYRTYPQAQTLVRELLAEVDRKSYILPNGDPLSQRRIQALGIMLGRDDGAGSLFHLLEGSQQRNALDELSTKFLYALQEATSFHTNPIYALLHEAIYCEEECSGWGAETVRASLSVYSDPVGEVFFDGEMVFPWMFEEIGALQPFAGAMQLLVAKENWDPLYDLDRLRSNQVPAACLIYEEDMYVDRSISRRVADEVGSLRTWVTNEYEHNGIRADGPRIFKRLLAMIDDDVLAGL